MDNDKIEQVLRTVDPAKRTFLKKLLIGAAFAVPIIASYSVKDLAYADVGSPITTTKTATATATATTTTFTTTKTTTTSTTTVTTTTI